MKTRFFHFSVWFYTARNSPNSNLFISSPWEGRQRPGGPQEHEVKRKINALLDRWMQCYKVSHSLWAQPSCCNLISTLREGWIPPGKSRVCHRGAVHCSTGNSSAIHGQWEPSQGKRGKEFLLLAEHRGGNCSHRWKETLQALFAFSFPSDILRRWKVNTKWGS